MLIYKLSLKIKDCTIEFKKGLGIGVLATVEVSFPTATEEDKSNPMFLVALQERMKELMEDIVEVEVAERTE